MGSYGSFMANKLEDSRQEVAELRKRNAELVRDMNALDGCWEKKVGGLLGLLKESLKWVEYWDSHESAIELARRINEVLKEGER